MVPNTAGVQVQDHINYTALTLIYEPPLAQAEARFFKLDSTKRSELYGTEVAPILAIKLITVIPVAGNNYGN